MEKGKEKDLNVHRVRSTQAAISDGYRLFARHFGCLLRGSWIAALLYALSMGCALAYLFTCLMPSMLIPGAQPSMGGLVLWLGLMAAYTLAILLFVCSAGFAPLRQHEQTGEIQKPRHWWGRWPWALVLRALVVVFWLSVATALGTMVIGLLLWALVSITGQGFAAHGITFTVVGMVLQLLLMLLLLPLFVTSFDRMMAPRLRLSFPLKGYGLAARHIGKIAATAIVVWLVVGVVSAIVQLPAFILTSANVEALVDMARGDTVDLPQPLFWFNFITFALSGLLQAYLHLSTLFPFYYVWGSIKAQAPEAQAPETADIAKS